MFERKVSPNAIGCYPFESTSGVCHGLVAWRYNAMDFKTTVACTHVSGKWTAVQPSRYFRLRKRNAEFINISHKHLFAVVTWSSAKILNAAAPSAPPLLPLLPLLLATPCLAGETPMCPAAEVSMILSTSSTASTCGTRSGRSLVMPWTCGIPCTGQDPL